ncbi:MAG: FMN-binding protein [Lachnospiraceae bacterium]|nr:FMN-binding protein [Lachnospiraceae bacterium]
MVATVVVAKNGKIESVILKGEGETARIGGAALEELEKAFVEANTYEVDVVSGATITSEAAIEAVDIALGLGGGDLAQGGGWDEISYRDGVYTGEGDGYDGAVIAEVTISGGEVTGVKLSGEDEGQEIGNAALRKMESAFVAAGSAEVDGVSGATFTSDGSIDAVEDALAQAQR